MDVTGRGKKPISEYEILWTSDGWEVKIGNEIYHFPDAYQALETLSEKVGELIKIKKFNLRWFWYPLIDKIKMFTKKDKKNIRLMRKAYQYTLLNGLETNEFNKLLKEDGERKVARILMEKHKVYRIDVNRRVSHKIPDFMGISMWKLKL